jgi:hypothetical protein
MNGPRAAFAFLVVTALVFALLLAGLAWRARAASAAGWLLGAGIVVAILTVVLGLFLARGVGEGRL